MIKLILKVKHALIERRFKRACRQANELHRRYGCVYRVFNINGRFVVWSKAEVRLLKDRGLIKRGFYMSRAIYRSNPQK